MACEPVPSMFLSVTRYAKALAVQKMDICTYGAYELLHENSLTMEVIGLKSNSLVLVERSLFRNYDEQFALIEDKISKVRSN